MNNKYQEKITLGLKASKNLLRADLHKWLLRNGYKSIDDFYYLKRTDKCGPWQSERLLKVSIFSDGVEIYETEEDIEEGISTSWNRLEIDYLIAFLPRELIDALVEAIDKICAEFQLEIEFMGESVDSRKLLIELNSIADSLEEFGGAGSKTLIYLINLEY